MIDGGGSVAGGADEAAGGSAAGTAGVAPHAVRAGTTKARIARLTPAE
jgi:hypothetical protein